MTIVLAGTFSGRGGIQTHLFWLSLCLLEQGHKVRVCSLGPCLGEAEQEKVDRLNDCGDFGVLCPQSGAHGTIHGPFRTAVALTRLLRSLEPAAFIACGTGWNLFLPAILSGTCPRRIFHEVMSGHSSGRLDSRRMVPIAFHEVVAQASPVAQTFRQQFGWKRDVPVLPAFPEPLEITAQLPAVIQHTVEPGKIRAAFFSRLVPHKGALWLVQQWPALSTWLDELHIFGTGPEEHPIQDLIRASGWQSKVFCHGPYPDGQAYADLLSTFDLTLLPTVGAEGAPLVLLESMACGVPFVAYGVGGIPDYANPDCEVIEPDSPRAFLQGVERIAQKLARQEIDQKRLQSFYVQHFSYSCLKTRWLEFIESPHKEAPALA